MFSDSSIRIADHVEYVKNIGGVCYTMQTFLKFLELFKSAYKETSTEELAKISNKVTVQGQYSNANSMAAVQGNGASDLNCQN